MIEKQKYTIIAIALLILISIFAYYIIIRNDKREIAVDLSDINSMNIGSEMPRILYADKETAVMQGTFGVIVFNIEGSIITNRISYEDLKKYDVSMLNAAVSKDGSIIYIGNDDMNGGFSLTHKYNIRTGTIKRLKQKPDNLITPIVIESPGDNDEYDKYFDLRYLISNTIVELDDSFVYIQAKSDWSMKSLQLVICQYSDGSSEVYDIFG
ncbi:MAG: hypothetical protein GX129_06465 [Clostridiales bacterium]|jgi:hypothetical protein|nr:hypothetical protein [Clostridiales bacterium]